MFTSVRGRTIYYETRGKGQPIVFVHGMGGNSAIWYTQAKALSSSFRTIAYDWMGAGRSSKPHSAHSVERWADELKALCDLLGVSSIGLVAHSLGAAVAIDATVRYPGLVKAIALFGPVIRLDPSGAPVIQERAAQARDSRMAEIAEMLAAGALAPATVESNPSVLTLFRAMLLANDPECYALQCEALLSADVEASVSEVRCPVLLLAGDSDRTAPAEMVERLAARLHYATTTLIPDGGHAMQLDRPGTVSRALSEFFHAELRPLANSNDREHAPSPVAVPAK